MMIFLNAIDEEETFVSLKIFDEQLQHQSKFLRNFKSMHEILLLFTRATRQDIWNLHLTSLLELMIPYFFAHDLQNYARLMPEYLAQMYELKEKDNRTWEFLTEGNFSVNKSALPFNAIGADHSIEQENRTLKSNRYPNQQGCTSSIWISRAGTK